MSFLRYGITVWGQTFDSYIGPIITLQKTLFGHTLPIVRSLQLLKIWDVFKLRIVTFLFESLNKPAPHVFDTHFLLNSSVHSYESRKSPRGDIHEDKKTAIWLKVNSIHGKELMMNCF